MKKTLLILAHPDMKNSKINRTLIESLLKEKIDSEIRVHDLYSFYPDFLIDIEKEQDLVSQYDRLVFQFPLYWYNVTPLLRKWMDDVFGLGFAYGDGGDKLEGKEFAAVVTTGAAQDVFCDDDCGSMETLLKHFDSSAKFCRSKYIGYHAFYGSYSDDVDERLKENVKEYLTFLRQ